MFGIDWVGLSVPFAYIVVLAGSLVTFSSIYRKRIAGTDYLIYFYTTRVLTVHSKISKSCAMVPSTSSAQRLLITASS